MVSERKIGRPPSPGGTHSGPKGGRAATKLCEARGSSSNITSLKFNHARMLSIGEVGNDIVDSFYTLVGCGDRHDFKCKLRQRLVVSNTPRQHVTPQLISNKVWRINLVH